MQDARSEITTAYYLHLGHTLQCKNKLEKELLELFQELDGTLIQIEDLPKFKVNLAMKVAEINNKNPRCKAIEVYYFNLLTQDSISIQGIPCFSSFLYPVTQNFKP